jgi:hypothetical protein
MSRATLKRSLGEAGAFFDASNGADKLLDVLQALAASSGETIGYSQATPSTGIKGALLCDTPTMLSNVYMKAAVCGTAGTTSIKVNVNGVQKATLSIGNAEADGTAKGLAIGLKLEAGDLVELEVSAVGTGATGLSATVRLKPVTVEA